MILPTDAIKRSIEQQRNSAKIIGQIVDASNGTREAMTQEEIILSELTNEWQPSYNFIMTGTKNGWLGSSADRRCRKMAEEGKIERKQDGKYAYYRLKQKTKPTKPIEPTEPIKPVFGDTKAIYETRYKK